MTSMPAPRIDIPIRNSPKALRTETGTGLTVDSLAMTCSVSGTLNLERMARLAAIFPTSPRCISYINAELQSLVAWLLRP